jgi:hypothetical protein
MANQTFPSGPTMMGPGSLRAAGSGKRVTAPVVVIRPIQLTSPLAEGWTVNHRLPSGPAVMSTGTPLDPRGCQLNVPLAVTRPMPSPSPPVNQRAPSGPAAMPRGPKRDGTMNRRTAPAPSSRPIVGPPLSDRVNHSAPSGVTARDPGVASMPATGVLASGNGPGGRGASRRNAGGRGRSPTADVPTFTANPRMKAPIMA